MTTRWLAGAGAVLLAAGALAAGPDYEVKTAKPGDAVTVAKDGGRLVVTVASKTGIGSCTVRPKEGDWPREVVLRFRYADGKPFTALESFRLTTPRFKLDGNHKDTPRMPLFFANAAGGFDKGAVPGGWANVAVKFTPGGLELVLPANFLVGRQEVGLNWIDFYRQ